MREYIRQPFARLSSSVTPSQVSSIYSGLKGFIVKSSSLIQIEVLMIEGVYLPVSPLSVGVSTVWKRTIQSLITENNTLPFCTSLQHLPR